MKLQLNKKHVKKNLTANILLNDKNNECSPPYTRNVAGIAALTTSN